MLQDDGTSSHFEIGNQGLLLFMGERYLFSVIDNAENALRVSFPVSDFPAEGMSVTLEFHDEAGYAAYETEVLENTHRHGDGLLLRQPTETTRTHHRNSWRIPTDFRVQLKDQVHPRWHECPVINLSAFGLLVRVEADLKPGDNVDLRVTLPEATESAPGVGKVIHVEEVTHLHDGAILAGIQFVTLEPATAEALAHYVWRRLRELNPAPKSR
jgi:hypothetical protein